MNKKECHFCREEIKENAIKCKHCNEILSSYDFTWRLSKVDRTLKLYDLKLQMFNFSLIIIWIYLSIVDKLFTIEWYTTAMVIIALILFNWYLFKQYKEVLDNT